jgi:hypothetical protein
MSDAEFRRWQLFHAETPIDDQSNHHFPLAYLQSTLVNVNRDTKKTQPARMRDFLLFRRPPDQDEQDIDALLLSGNW